MALTDEDLLREVASGGREAFVALYDRYAARVFGLLTKLIPDRTDAEDTLQDVMWEIWRKADRYDPSLGSAQTWILLTARSRAIDTIRRRRRAADLARAVADARRDGQLVCDPARAETADAANALDAAFAGLPTEQQTALRMAYMHGLTRQEISEATGTPVGTVKTRISLGVRKLVEGETQRKGGNA